MTRATLIGPRLLLVSIAIAHSTAAIADSRTEIPSLDAADGLCARLLTPREVRSLVKTRAPYFIYRMGRGCAIESHKVGLISDYAFWFGAQPPGDAPMDIPTTAEVLASAKHPLGESCGFAAWSADVGPAFAIVFTKQKGVQASGRVEFSSQATKGRDVTEEAWKLIAPRLCEVVKSWHL
jgi:hypothetical protein